MRLPTFLVVGAAKAGTTSLHFHLRHHPDVFVPGIKEINYFWAEGAAEGRRVPRSLEEYAACFEGATTERAVGEVSPQYLNSPSAAARIRRDLPDVGVVVLLRNPVERAYSDYLGRSRIAREDRSIDEVIRPGEPVFENGFYHERLVRYFARFPRDRIHIVLHDDLVRDTAAALRTLFCFLGVDPEHPVDMSVRRNAAGLPRHRRINRLIWTAIPVVQRWWPAEWQGTGRVERWLRRSYVPAPPCPPHVVSRLRAAYRDDVLATSELIRRDLSPWLVAEAGAGVRS